MARPPPRPPPHPADAEPVASGDRTLCLIVCALAALVAAVAAVIALAGALALAATDARASGELACAGVPFAGEQARVELSARAPNPTARQILIEHALAWEADEIVRLCDARAAGEDVALGCLEGRRDWDAIASAVPFDLRTADTVTKRAHLTELRDARRSERPREAAEAHCRAVGAIAGDR